MASAISDRNLLFGILALQNDFVTREQLIAAMNAWVFTPDRPLGDLLREGGALDQEEYGLLEGLVNRQLSRHQGDIEKSLQALAQSSSIREALADLTNPYVQPNLARIARASSQQTLDLAARPGGERLRYRVLRSHARGGLGEIFVAEDSELHREVALKEIQERYADDPACRGRFLLEAEITGRLEHPGIVPVYGLGSNADGRPYYVMRFIKGDNLGNAIKRFQESKERFDTLAFRQLLRRFLDVCNAIAYSHARGVLHRDLKPGNVMLGEYGETLVVDWGLAKVVGRSDPTAGEKTLRPSRGEQVETVTGAAMGTPAYMSPEQAEGKLDALGPATDVYSLGATLYSLLTGRAPVSGSDLADVLETVRNGSILQPREVRADVPKPLAAICVKAMAFQPGDRYPTALALAGDVESWLADEPVHAYRDSLWTRMGRTARKHRTLVTTFAAVLLVALLTLSLGLIVVGGLNRRLETSNAQLNESNDKLDTALTVAEEKRQEAEKERNNAVAVNTFLQHDLLGQSDIANQPILGKKEYRNPSITVVELLDRASSTIEGKFKDQPETEAAIRQTIGRSYHALGKYDLAQPHLQRSLAIREKKLGTDHPDIFTSKNNLATLYQSQGKYDRAAPLLLEAFQWREKHLGADHPDTLTSKNNLATLYQDQGKYDKAETLLREVVRQREKALGSDHRYTFTSKNNLATLYQA